MTEKRFTIHAAVYLLLIKDDQVLLLRRFNTGWSDGMYTLIAGHIDGDEPLTTAMAREAKEEAGIDLKPDNVKFAHVVHRVSEKEYLDFFFTATDWTGEPQNTEPEKCDDMQWFPLDDLPKNTLPHVRQIITDIRAKVPYSEIGWQAES